MINSLDIFQGKILIVDDKESDTLLIKRMLQGAGYVAVSTTTDPAKVCELHLLNQYDLILLDIEMPGMDGFQVMENLKGIETDGYIPVLAVTAQPEHRVRALQAGARDFVSKPFDLAEVSIRIHNLLQVRLMHQETKRLYARVVAEKKLSERLLLNTLPQAIAESLSGRPEATESGSSKLITESYAELTVIFADIVEFTKWAEGASAEVLIGVLNDISTRFDNLPDAPGFKRNKTIGNAYLATVGLPDAVANHTIRAAGMALDMIDALDRFNERSRYKLDLRIGIDTGTLKADPLNQREETTYDL